MIKTVEPLNFYTWQQYVLQNLARYNVIIASRQHGKTTFVCEIINTVVHAPLIKMPLINLCSDKASRLFPIYSQRLNELFDGMGPWSYKNGEKPNSLVQRADGRYALINFIGSIAKPTGCTGTPAHLNIIDECDLVNQMFIFKSAMPATDKTEGITICTGTMGPNIKLLYEHAFKKMLEGDPHWFAFKLDFGDEWSQQVHTLEARRAIESRYDMSNPEHKAIFDTEYMNIVPKQHYDGQPYLNDMLKAEMQGRVKHFNVSPSHPVNLAWDDGRGVTAIWMFQVIGEYIYFFDYIEWKQSSLPHIAKNRYFWYANNGFIYGTQVVPHTMSEKSYELESKASRISIVNNIFKKKGNFCKNPRVRSIPNKFAAGSSIFSRCVFHPRCNDKYFGLNKLKQYSREKHINSATKLVTYKDAVARNEASHAGDSFSEVAMAYLSGKLHVKLHELSVPRIVPHQSNYSVLNPY